MQPQTDSGGNLSQVELSYERALTAEAQEICLQIMTDSRRELYLSMRYLDLPLASLAPQVNTELRAFATDGRILAVHPQLVMDWFRMDRRRINRIFLHEVLHCLFRHLFKKPAQDPLLWQLSCDIAVESVIDSLPFRCVKTGVSLLRRNTYEELRKTSAVLTAENICRILGKKELSEAAFGRLVQEFCLDDHSLWPWENPSSPPPPEEMEMLRNQWQDISERTQTEMETFARDSAKGAGDLDRQVKAENRKRMDYRSFLRKFSVIREEMGTDPDTFDYVFYTYGLSVYGNMPLIEPQEYREVKKIEEFVLVLDVSMSTSGELIRNFLEETWAVLTEQESYLRKVHIHILQCDERVVDDARITSREELKKCMETFTLKGGGGTDFRPAFAYVEELIRRKELTDLRGMIYFTDGRGIYPSRKPRWETAFVFLEKDYTDVSVPPWAIKLVLPEAELEEQLSVRTDHSFL